MSLTVYCKIDEGNFGKIYLARKNGGIDNGVTYAIKSVQTDPENTYNEQHRICINELKVFNLVHKMPFFLQLKYACKTRHEYNFVMDFIPGGNLYDYVSSKRLTLAEAQVCSAEIVSAVSYLHERFFVYRDLKLENILISNDGHILLTDFGLARPMDYFQPDFKLYDTAGTLGYFAPEMLLGDKGHSYEVDWWSLGILIYELLLGHSPFLIEPNENITEKVLFSRILNDEPSLFKLRTIKQNTQIVEDFIQKLLIKDPRLRLGYGQFGHVFLKDHPFFNQLDWAAVNMKKYRCLNPKVQTRSIPIEYGGQFEISLNYPKDREKSRKEFFYRAPELQQHRLQPRIDYVLGSTPEEVQQMKPRIKIDSMTSIDILLGDNLYIRTMSVEAASQALKQLIIPQRIVRFDDSVPTPKTPTTAQSQRSEHQLSQSQPKPRRSGRIAKRRSSAFH